MFENNRSNPFPRPVHVLRYVITVFAVMAWSMWIAGFTFFTSISLRVAHKILGEGHHFGFVTQIVTERINQAGIIAVILLTLHLILHRSEIACPRLIAMTITCLTLMFTLGTQIHMHGLLDQLIDAPARRVLDDATFAPIHDRYQMYASIQWAVAIIHLAPMLYRPLKHGEKGIT